MTPASDEGRAFALAQSMRSRARWSNLSADERRAATAPAVEARRLNRLRREAQKVAFDGYSAEAFVAAMELHGALKAPEPERRSAATGAYSSRVLTAALDLDVALRTIESGVAP